MEGKQEALMKVVSDLGTAKFSVPEIGVKEIVKRLEEKDSSLVLLDARTLEEREVGIIAGSITKDEFLQNPSGTNI